MTASDTRETVAFAMWKHEALRAAPNVGRKRTAEDFAGASDAERSKWLGLADAAIAAIPAVHVGVKPLEWVYDEVRGVWSAQDGFGRHYTVSDSQWFHGSLSEFIWVDGGDEAAKAAAQAGHEASVRSALTAQQSPDVMALVEALDKTTAHGQRIDYSRVGHNLSEASWHVHLAGFRSRDDAEAFLSAALARVKGGAA